MQLLEVDSFCRPGGGWGLDGELSTWDAPPGPVPLGRDLWGLVAEGGTPAPPPNMAACRCVSLSPIASAKWDVVGVAEDVVGVAEEDMGNEAMGSDPGDRGNN